MRAALIKSMLRAFSLLPLAWAHGLGVVIGWGLFLVPNQLRRVTNINLSLCFPELTHEARQQMVRRSLIETAKAFTEMGALWLWQGRKVLRLVRQVSGEKEMRGALASGQGVILVAPHLGVWEIIGLYFPDILPMTILYRPPRQVGLHNLIVKARQRMGAKLVTTDTKGVRAFYQALHRGEALGILPDQEPGAGNGIFAPFFGVPAYTMVLLSRIAMKTKAPVLFTYVERLPRGQGFHLHFLPAPPEIYAATLEQSVTVVNAMVERCARALPHQYHWGYKRFRTRPDGEPKVY